MAAGRTLLHHELPFTPRGDELDVGERRLSFGGRKVSSATLCRVSATRDGKPLLASSRRAARGTRR